MQKENRAGMVFSIERFSIHDGPGVRTSVFLKGCSLSCIWCHNPESQRGNKELKYLDKNCIHCGACEEACPNGVHQVQADVHSLRRELCTACGACVKVCPAEALTLVGKRMDVEEVMQVVQKDRIYYQDDGGITLSGGEPLAQAGFCAAILKRCKEVGISTCVETAGDVKREAFLQVMEQTDLFLYDFKLSAAEQMRQYTGGCLERVLSNLRFLRREGKDVILRCPVIPGINDEDIHFERIAALAEDLDIEKVELMPYHSYGKEKWEQTGKEYRLHDLASVSKEQAEFWRRKLSSYRRRPGVCE